MTGKVVVYPTVTGSTSGAVSLYYKVKQSHHGPVAIICRDSLHPSISAAPLLPRFRPWTSLDQDPITTIKNGDMVEIDAPEVGEKATVTITRKGVILSNESKA